MYNFKNQVNKVMSNFGSLMLLTFRDLITRLKKSYPKGVPIHLIVYLGINLCLCIGWLSLGGNLLLELCGFNLLFIYWTETSGSKYMAYLTLVQHAASFIIVSCSFLMGVSLGNEFSYFKILLDILSTTTTSCMEKLSNSN